MVPLYFVKCCKITDLALYFTKFAKFYKVAKNFVTFFIIKI